MVLRCLAAAGGFYALWRGCNLVNAPLQLGGPMNFALNVPFGVPLLTLGVVGVALSPGRGWTVAWCLAALIALAAAGTNFWHQLPIEDGAFQSLRAGVPDPDTWPAPPFLHALALAPAGCALAVLMPGPRRVVPLLTASAAAAVASGFGLHAFEEALRRSETGAGSVTSAILAGAILVGAILTGAILATAAARGAHPAGRAVAGQAAVLTVLCVVLWLGWSGII